LGTSSSVPTKERNHTGVFLKYKDEGILFDCGENIQRQLKIAGIKVSTITKIIITHWHGDHCLGLPGLIQSMGSAEYAGTLDIYGPPVTLENFKRMFSWFSAEITIKINVHEIKPGIFFNGKDFSIEGLPLRHRVTCYGYSLVEHDKRKINMSSAKKLGIPEGPLIGKLQEGESITVKGKKIDPDKVSTVVKGRKFAFVTDTAMCENCYKLAENADLLLCESTFHSDLADMAEKKLHLTSKDAGQIASKSNVKKLVLTHFSARYKNTQELEEDARTVFDNVTAAKDFTKLTL